MRLSRRLELLEGRTEPMSNAPIIRATGLEDEQIEGVELLGGRFVKRLPGESIEALERRAQLRAGSNWPCFFRYRGKPDLCPLRDYGAWDGWGVG